MFRSINTVIFSLFISPIEVFNIKIKKKRSALTDNTNKRLIYLSKYFINGLILNRKDMHPKKPYNPVLGELFIATFKVPKSNFTGKNENSSNSEYFEYEFVAEQVSHHPPSIYKKNCYFNLFSNSSNMRKIKLILPSHIQKFHTIFGSCEFYFKFFPQLCL